MSGPPVAEALLRGCIADPGLEEAVLGDLAEEWGERAADDGVDAANGWYRVQALRSAPHLVAAWWRCAGPREFWRTLGRAVLVLAAAVLLAALTFVGMLIVSDGPPGAPPPRPNPHALALAMIVASAGWAFLSGVVVAVRTRRAPMAAAGALALGWIPATLVPAVAFPTPPGAPVWLYLAFPAALALATAVGGAAATLLRRPDGAKASDSDPSTLVTTMTTKTENTPFRRRAVRVVAVTTLLLTVPLVAMQFTAEVDWSWFDFAFMGALVMGVGLTYEFAAMKTGNSAYRFAVGAALAAAFLLVWVNGAVGLIGSEGNPANLMYAGVLAVALAGAVGARFEPLGMARAMFTTAAAQALVATIAIVYGLGAPASGPVELVATNGFWVAMWLASAWLFRKAAVQPIPTRATAEG